MKTHPLSYYTLPHSKLELSFPLFLYLSILFSFTLLFLLYYSIACDSYLLPIILLVCLPTLHRFSF